VTRPKRFRDMELTEDEVRAIVLERGRLWPSLPKREKRLSRARRLLPLWRKWSIERERLWFALIGLGLDIEGDERDMPREEMRRRIERARPVQHPHHIDFVLRELDQ